MLPKFPGRVHAWSRQSVVLNTAKRKASCDCSFASGFTGSINGATVLGPRRVASRHKRRFSRPQSAQGTVVVNNCRSNNYTTGRPNQPQIQPKDPKPVLKGFEYTMFHPQPVLSVLLWECNHQRRQMVPFNLGSTASNKRRSWCFCGRRAGPAVYLGEEITDLLRRVIIFQ